MTAAGLPLRYSQKRRPAAFAVTYTLEDGRLSIDSGRKVEQVALDTVAAMRLTYDPRSFAQRAYETTLTLKTGRRIRFSSVHWKSLIEAETRPDYRDFAPALIRAVAAANPRVVLAAGRPRAAWLAITGLTLLCLVAVILFVGRALAEGATTAAGLGAVIGLAGVWQLEPMVRLNRPRVFTPDAVPPDLLP